MAQSGKSGTCALVCWIIAIVLGLIAVKLTAGGMPFVIPLFIGIIVALVVGILLTRMFCKAQAETGSMMPAKSATQQTAEADAASAAKAKAEAEEAARKAEAEAAAAQEAARQAEEEAARQAASEAAAAEAAMAAEAEAEAAEAEVAAAKAAPAEDNPVEVKPALLDGQNELESRKGEWKYEADTADSAAATTAADEAAPAAEEAAQAAAATAGPDDLKQLKGVGPKLEQKLHEAGVTTFAQIAAWGADDIAKMDDLLSFKGRITRDGWVEQAKTLAAGEATEFSKRVSDGDVY